MDKKSILIGALGASLLFVSIGATTYTTEKQNKFEVHVQQSTTHNTNFIRAYLVNTETGETWFLRDDEKTKHTE